MKLSFEFLIAAVQIATTLSSGAAIAQTVRNSGAAQTQQVSTVAANGKTNPLAGDAEIFENLTEASP